MKPPLVSVVICTYNQQNFVRETLDSVLAQTYPNIEIIVGDDGSTDTTPEILREYATRFPNKIKVVLSPINTGIPSNINRAMAQHTGEFVAWLDGDDVQVLGSRFESNLAEGEGGGLLGFYPLISETAFISNSTSSGAFIPTSAPQSTQQPEDFIGNGAGASLLAVAPLYRT